MQIIKGYFDKLHFTECRLGVPQRISKKLIIPVRNLLPLKGHPLSDGNIKMISGKLIFIDASKSVRRIIEYIGDPQSPDGFKDEYSIEDLYEIRAAGQGALYLIEGISDQPLAWTDWEIVAKGFELLVDI
jgi:hypothetical protein